MSQLLTGIIGLELIILLFPNIMKVFLLSIALIIFTPLLIVLLLIASVFFADCEEYDREA